MIDLSNLRPAVFKIVCNQAAGMSQETLTQEFTDFACAVRAAAFEEAAKTVESETLHGLSRKETADAIRRRAAKLGHRCLLPNLRQEISRLSTSDR